MVCGRLAIRRDLSCIIGTIYSQQVAQILRAARHQSLPWSGGQDALEVGDALKWRPGCSGEEARMLWRGGLDTKAHLQLCPAEAHWAFSWPSEPWCARERAFSSPWLLFLHSSFHSMLQVIPLGKLGRESVGFKERPSEVQLWQFHLAATSVTLVVLFGLIFLIYETGV